ncbi:MAG: hypothetical protein U9N08_00295 [Candidatus Caldatribacteriota bacterium]|nr:hypothetical protein [Candidatus Caldatribacteriota bacterium]
MKYNLMYPYWKFKNDIEVVENKYLYYFEKYHNKVFENIERVEWACKYKKSTFYPNRFVLVNKIAYHHKQISIADGFYI